MITAEVPVTNYLDSVRTPKRLHQFVREVAPPLCNATILKFFSFKTSDIPSKMDNGWIVPTHPDIALLEAYVLEKKSTSILLEAL